MVSSMKDDGRCAVILPQGVLFHTGKEAEMRKQLIESDMLECVITLVKGVFFSTGVNACILLLNKKKQASHKEKICFIDASKIYTALRAQNIMTEENITEVFKLYCDYSDVIEKSKVIGLSEIKDMLMPKDYIDHVEKAKINPDVVREEYLSTIDKLNNDVLTMKKLLKEGGFIDE
jgi:type I restriction enzyme M protein